MKLINKAITITMACIMLSGCVFVHDGFGTGDWQKKQVYNKEVINGLTLGTSRGDILSQLGTPEFTEAFLKNSDEYRVIYYRTSRRHSDSMTTKDETTPIIFKNNKLIGWGSETSAHIY